VAEPKNVRQKIFNLALHDLTDSPSLRRTSHRHNGYEKQAEDGVGRRKGSGLQEIALEEEGEGCEEREVQPVNGKKVEEEWEDVEEEDEDEGHELDEENSGSEEEVDGPMKVGFIVYICFLF